MGLFAPASVCVCVWATPRLIWRCPGCQENDGEQEKRKRSSFSFPLPLVNIGTHPHIYTQTQTRTPSHPKLMTRPPLHNCSAASQVDERLAAVMQSLLCSATRCPHLHLQMCCLSFASVSLSRLHDFFVLFCEWMAAIVCTCVQYVYILDSRFSSLFWTSV